MKQTKTRQMRVLLHLEFGHACTARVAVKKLDALPKSVGEVHRSEALQEATSEKRHVCSFASIKQFIHSPSAKTELLRSDVVF
ncbi:hypothetical protein [Pseudomonas sp. QTF5]|uniref:hypothetical protein n=1 Tax=Pseudomonas sp. QTF5 TaxID=1435425 RepID=UPI0004B51BE5|nr:hypothetical protein [Pseudomonas sp. QTF5]